MRANERSERPSGLFKTRSSLTRNAPSPTKMNAKSSLWPPEGVWEIDLELSCDSLVTSFTVWLTNNAHRFYNTVFGHLSVSRVFLFFVLFFGLFVFLVACTRLYDPLCPSVGWSGRRSVGPSVHHTLLLLVFFRCCFSIF